ncbi:aldo/keto reductase [Engelhardtia mirabilis]|uniref:General stress protein 69 n=1 Tax=Engelhardtia mirabilis TaxID=2528011 RepID=A0A518BDW0_9BACT|nr:General stress protein 69 [Planctomycetes bacterium Pla133]QDU99497.1 General stress protein 69 [Planctomycetes bacterium Pla86]
MNTDRRRLLGGLAAGAIAVPALAASSRGAQEASATRVAIRRKRIPRSGELLPMIGLGTSRTFDVDPATVSADLVTVMGDFLDLGGSLIDSSPMYGQAESVVGELLRRVGRDDAFHATKVWTDKGREAGIEQMETSEQRMGTERFDLLQVHNLVDLEVQLATLREWKASGRVRYIGVTEMRDFEQVEKLIAGGEIDFVQIPYSLAEREVEARVLPAALDHGVAVLVMRPFQRGGLFEKVGERAVPDWATELGCRSWAQVFLKFLLGHPAVTCPIPATSKPHHLLDNMAAGVGPLPDAAWRERAIADVMG